MITPTNLNHGGATEISWANGEAVQPASSATVLWLVIVADWTLYLMYAFLTLINYSYFAQSKTSAASTAMQTSYSEFSKILTAT